MIKLIVFDMDGVIVDTEYLDFQLQQEYIKTIAQNPAALTHEDFSSLVGRSGKDLLTRIKKLSQLDLADETIEQGLQRVEAQKYRKESYLPLFRKDIFAVLEYAKANHIALGVASSTQKKYILEILTNCGIKDYFDVIVSGEDFEASKPDPAIYLSVLKRLGVPSEQALAVEDSPSGIASAKGAGMRTVAYEEKRMTIDQSQADYVAKDMLDILDYIKSV
ncbi:HAD family hydrolase [Streptococcus caviae]|uniref:HAD family hydrolase n=1 Tax=Streptococcus sp. 'caviae' TaxID=1915004 RepID=UPI00094BB111|nr:HAD-IA family hydrolase [Streptococcus sp. 'caviae']OLN82581.1 haloacid dehalogenase [Streptococcus sp. 'caviae']